MEHLCGPADGDRDPRVLCVGVLSLRRRQHSEFQRIHDPRVHRKLVPSLADRKPHDAGMHGDRADGVDLPRIVHDVPLPQLAGWDGARGRGLGGRLRRRQAAGESGRHEEPRPLRKRPRRYPGRPEAQ